MNQLKQNNLYETLPVGRQLLEEGYDLKNPLHYVVSRAEYNELREEGDEYASNEDYEEYCEHERECWNEMAIPLMTDPWRYSATSPAINRPVL